MHILRACPSQQVLQLINETAPEQLSTQTTQRSRARFDQKNQLFIHEFVVFANELL